MLPCFKRFPLPKPAAGTRLDAPSSCRQIRLRSSIAEARSISLKGTAMQPMMDMLLSGGAFAQAPIGAAVEGLLRGSYATGSTAQAMEELFYPAAEFRQVNWAWVWTRVVLQNMGANLHMLWRGAANKNMRALTGPWLSTRCCTPAPTRTSRSGTRTRQCWRAWQGWWVGGREEHGAGRGHTRRCMNPLYCLIHTKLCHVCLWLHILPVEVPGGSLCLCSRGERPGRADHSQAHKAVRSPPTHKLPSCSACGSSRYSRG